MREEGGGGKEYDWLEVGWGREEEGGGWEEEEEGGGGGGGGREEEKRSMGSRER